MFIFSIFLIWRLLDFTIAYLVPNLIPYLGFFPYKDIINGYNLPSFLTALANFDGAHYISIAREGYHQYEQAFFPLYPLFIRFLSPIFSNNHLLTGLIISNVLFLIGLIVSKKYIDMISNSSYWAILFLLFFPTSFFFGAVYTEGLFFFLAIFSLYFLKKEKYLSAAICAFFSSLTRLIGVFLVIPFAIELIQKAKIPEKILSYKLIVALFSPLLGLSLYAAYLWQTTNDPLYFFHAQDSFNLNRSTSLILLPQVYYRYFKILFTADRNFQYFISLLEITIFTLVLLILILDLVKIIKNPKGKLLNSRFGLNLFSLMNLLLPTLTGTFLSIPRFALMSLSLFLFLGEIRNRYIKLIIIALFAFFHILIMGLFIQGYFVS